MRGALWLLVLGCAASPATAREPAVDYMLECRGCHRPDGSGSPGVPALRDSVARFLLVPGGREYLVRVPGSAQSALDDAELAALLNWMVHTFGPAAAAADSAPFGAEEVARLRRSPFTDVDAVRAELVRALAAVEPPD